MKKLICAVILLLIVPTTVNAQEALPTDIQCFLNDNALQADSFISMKLSDVFSWITESLKDKYPMSIGFFAELLGCVLFCAAVHALTLHSKWNDVLESLCVLSIFAIALPPILELNQEMGNVAFEWRNYLISFIPAFSGILISCGQPGQAVIYSGMFLTMASFAAQMISAVAIPALNVYLALNTAAGLCNMDALKDCGKLLEKIVKWGIKFLSILFGAVLGLQSVLAQTTDTLAMKAGRFIVSSGIPIVGGVASEAMGSVIAGLKVVKGSLGFAAVVTMTVTFLPLLISSAAGYATYTLSAIAANAFGMKRVSNTLEGMGQAAGLCLSFLSFFFLLIVITTALMIVTGGG